MVNGSWSGPEKTHRITEENPKGTPSVYQFPTSSPNFQSWTNPQIYFFGLKLDFLELLEKIMQQLYRCQMGMWWGLRRELDALQKAFSLTLTNTFLFPLCLFIFILNTLLSKVTLLKWTLSSIFSYLNPTLPEVNNLSALFSPSPGLKGKSYFSSFQDKLFHLSLLSYPLPIPSVTRFY